MCIKCHIVKAKWYKTTCLGLDFHSNISHLHLHSAIDAFIYDIALESHAGGCLKSALISYLVNQKFKLGITSNPAFEQRDHDKTGTAKFSYLHLLNKCYLNDRLNNSLFLSPSLCTKRSILLGLGKLTQAVYKRCQAKIWHSRSWTK